MAKMVVTGIEKIDKKLAELGPKVSNKLVSQVMRNVMKQFVPELKSTIPTESGASKKSIKIRTGKRSTFKKSILVGIDREAFKGTDHEGAFYPVAQEWGTSKMQGKGAFRKAYDKDSNKFKDEAIHEILEGIEQLVAA